MDLYATAVVLDGLLSVERTLGPLMVLYVGPDQILPLTSIIGALVGLLLMFWHWVGGLVRRFWHTLTGR